MRLLHQAVEETTIPFVFTREPGGTPLGEKIRELLIDPLGQMAPQTEAMLVCASRAELVAKVIEPALAQGRLVVCDRFWDATLAYQGFGRGLPIGELQHSVMFAARRVSPHLTFLLDVPYEVARERVSGRRADRIEGEAAAFFERVANGYRTLAAEEPERFVVLDGTLPENELAVRIRTEVFTRWHAQTR